jgi:hypothetical protein
MVIWQQRRLNESLMMRVMKVMGSGEVVNGMLLDIRRNFRGNWNLLSMIFAHMELQALAGRKYFSALDALEC